MNDSKREKLYKRLKSMDAKRRLSEMAEIRLRLVSYKKVYIIKDAWEIVDIPDTGLVFASS